VTLIRAAQAADVPQLQFRMPWNGHVVKADDRVRAWFDHSFVFVAENIGGDIVGQVFASIYRSEDGAPWLWLFFLHVEEAWRGQRIGSRLMEYVERVAKEAMCEGVYLGVDHLNGFAREWYERRGYVAFGEREVDMPCYAEDGSPATVHSQETLMRRCA
jgi:predicted N-acetyltransferase YhbS